jgi:hypothetical protein
MLAFLVIIPLVAFSFYIYAIKKTLSAIDPSCRTQRPMMAWLLLIPIFNVIWFFFLLQAIRQGFDAMFQKNLIAKPIDSGYHYGIAMGSCWAASFIPGIFFISVLPMFVFSILHWTKLSNARDQITRDIPGIQN